MERDRCVELCRKQNKRHVWDVNMCIVLLDGSDEWPRLSWCQLLSSCDACMFGLLCMEKATNAAEVCGGAAAHAKCEGCENVGGM
jgi:hypothetical protein